MNKPDWKDSPEWARWLCQDGDGSWWWYENEPEWDALDNSWESIHGTYMNANENRFPNAVNTFEEKP